MSFESTLGIFDAHVSFEPPAEFQWAGVDIPDAIIDVLETDICPGAGGRDVDPLTVPPDVPIGTDVAQLEAVGILER